MLIGLEASLQHSCNKEGFNVLCTFISNSKARIGIVSNNNSDCRYCDSRIGFGTGCSYSPTVAGFSSLCFVPAFLAKCYRSFRLYYSVVCSVCFPVPWPLAILLPPPAVFTVFLPILFALLRSLLHICRLPAFLSVPACFVFRLACSLSQFHLLGHGFVPPKMWAEKILLHFILQNAISKTMQPRGSFNLG